MITTVNKGLVLVLGVFLVLASFGAGFYFAKSQSSVVSLVENVPGGDTAVQKKVVQSQSKRLDWQKYTNDTLGIEFEYPSSFGINLHGLSQAVPEIEIYPKAENTNDGPSLVIVKDKTVLYDNARAEQLLKRVLGKGSVIESSDVTIGGSTWKKTKYRTQSDYAPSGVEVIFYYTLKDGAFYGMGLSRSETKLLPDFEGIINSFRFIGR